MNLGKKEILEMMDSPNVQEAMKKVKTLGDVTAPYGPAQLMLKLMLDKLMEAERSQHLGYTHSDRLNKSEKNSRNGYSKRILETSFGSTEVEIPRDRQGTFYPSLLEKYKKLDPNIERKIITLYSKGVSTRDIADILGEIYGADVSPTLVSQVTNEIKEEIKGWQDRPLENLYPVVFFDAIFFKTREEGSVNSKAAYTCFGITAQGGVDILGIWIEETEGARFWLSVLNDLKSRGVNDILIACVDGLKGFPEAIGTIFPKTDIQLCIVHQIRNSLRYVGFKDQREFVSDMKAIYQAINLKIAQEALRRLEIKWGKKYPTAVNSWVQNWDRLTQYFQYPSEIRRMIYTTNAVENVHRQFRKVTKTKCSFPNDGALIKMLYFAIQGVVSKVRKKRDWPMIAGQLAIHYPGRMI